MRDRVRVRLKRGWFNGSRSIWREATFKTTKKVTFPGVTFITHLRNGITLYRFPAITEYGTFL